MSDVPDDDKKEPFFEQSEPSKMPWMIGMLDVLGFSNRIADEGVERIFETYKTLIERVIQKEPMRCIGTMRFPGEAARYPALFTTEVRYTYFSDCILLWLPLHPMLAAPFLQRCCDLICEALLMGIPIRGGIALGEGFMHRKTGVYLGQMIVDAHRLEEAQDWIGAAFSPSATWPQFLTEVSPTQVIEYATPIKPGKESLCSPIALDWPRRWRDTQTTPLQDRLRELCPSGPHSKYYTNAIEFADWSEKHHDWHTRSDADIGFQHLRMRPESEVISEAQP
jgi:hypothetical protein